MRQKVLFDGNWLFHKGDIKRPLPTSKGPIYSQSKTERMLWGPASIRYNANPDQFYGDKEICSDTWEYVTLPHDYTINETPLKENNCALGFLPYRNAWYRKNFFIGDDDKGKRLILFFEAVATECTVYLNGCVLKHNFSGYNSFEVDISDFVKFGEDNVLAVYVNAENHEGWWYEGAGIYRHVWLIKTGDVAVDTYGVYAMPKKVSETLWRIEVQTEIINASYTPVTVSAKTVFYDENCMAVAEGNGIVTVPDREKSIAKYLYICYTFFAYGKKKEVKILMTKSKTIFVCSECGNESSKWLGKCPACNSWNSFYEQKVVETKQGKHSELNKSENKPQKLNSYQAKETLRTSTGFGELDRVLGGGLVKGSLVLLGGEPGIGKSTLILQICDKVKGDGKVLYVSGEESAEQIKMRADRLGINNDDILFLGETDIDIVNQAIMEINPKLVIIDSIQTMYSEEISAAAGSVSQVREITSQVMRVCKSRAITTIIIGHVTKEGNIAGPRVLEHMVDTVLYLEGERYFSYRVLRGVKNRFGSTNEIGMFEMNEEGMCEITNPSDILISEREDNPAGSCIVSSIEGTRVILIELQALTTQSIFGFPKRTANGTDYNRLALLIAVLEKRAGVMLGSQDIYLNLVGGIKVNEPSIDLGMIMAVASSYKNVSIPKDMVIIGEVGLTGEVRRINLIDKRLKEAEKLGFKSCIIPQSNKKDLKEKYKLDIIGVGNINEAMKKIGLK